MKKVFLTMLLVTMMVLEANAQYKVGDIYDNGEVKGLVAKVSEDGYHGVLISLDAFGKRWTNGSDVSACVGAADEDDGRKNMAAIEIYINANGKSWEDFPLFDWARGLGIGWYIPASNELLELMINLNGGTTEFNEKRFKNIDKIVKKEKGTKFIAIDELAQMYSSTELQSGDINSVLLNESAGSIVGGLLAGRLASKKGEIVITPTLRNTTVVGKLGNRSRAIYLF